MHILIFFSSSSLQMVISPRSFVRVLFSLFASLSYSCARVCFCVRVCVCHLNAVYIYIVFAVFLFVCPLHVGCLLQNEKKHLFSLYCFVRRVNKVTLSLFNIYLVLKPLYLSPRSSTDCCVSCVRVVCFWFSCSLWKRKTV